MRSIKFTAPMFAALLAATICSSAFAQGAGVLPKPAECASTKTITLPRGNHPKDFKAYGKVDIYCGSSTTAMVTGATLCNSDYPESKADTKTVTIEVSTKSTSGKMASCKSGDDFKFVPE